MRVEVKLPDWVGEALMRMRVSSPDCGPDLADRLALIAEGAADAVVLGEARERKYTLYKTMGLRHPQDDDDIDL
jgi:hypothetical protein